VLRIVSTQKKNLPAVCDVESYAKLYNMGTYCIGLFGCESGLHLFNKIQSKAVVPKVCSAGHKGSLTSFQGIHGYISLMVTLKFDVLLR